MTAMPALFIGHGSPMNAIEENEFSRTWMEVGRKLPRPRAILSISAHWQTEGIGVTAMERPRTIHDFYGFPPELYEQRYPAPGSPSLAKEVAGLLDDAQLDIEWGLDHGTWSVLGRLFPGADIPVVQLSLDRFKDPAEHYRTGTLLGPLRERGVLILGSGNIVHNLMMAGSSVGTYSWATEFDSRVEKLILKGNHDALVHYEDWGEQARLSIPTNEHYLPMLYVLALKRNEDDVRFFAEGVALGSVSMRSFVLA
jgi:4,5-DOPA dioxygenase extradiol